MKITTLRRIYLYIEDEKNKIAFQRGQERVRDQENIHWIERKGRDGIAVMSDPLALKYQRLDRIQRHVGCHKFAQEDREERGMKKARRVPPVSTESSDNDSHESPIRLRDTASDENASPPTGIFIGTLVGTFVDHRCLFRPSRATKVSTKTRTGEPVFGVTMLP